MTLETIKQTLLYGGGIIILLTTIIQISPIKINPWSWIGRAIGRVINSEVLERVEKLSCSVKQIQEADDEQWASLRRIHILRFGDEILHGVSHTKEHFDQILLDISNYEKYCEMHPNYRNNVANETIKRIKQTYQDCLKKNNFL